MPKFKKNTSNAMGKSPFSLKSGNSPLYIDLGQYGSTSPIQKEKSWFKKFLDKIKGKKKKKKLLPSAKEENNGE